jgi:hypothetical protein
VVLEVAEERVGAEAVVAQVVVEHADAGVAVLDVVTVED